jgi:hypothetical protein
MTLRKVSRLTSDNSKTRRVALPRDAKRSTAAPSIDHTFRGSAPEREVKMKVRRSTQERPSFLKTK